MFKLHGVPKDIVSDRDSRLTGTFWTDLCQRLGIESKKSTAFHPQTDGQTERMNRTLGDYLRHFISPTMDDWDKHLPAAEFAVNNAVQDSTLETPFRLVYGQHPLTPHTRRLPDAQNRQAHVFVDQRQDMMARAKANLLAAQQRQKHYADKGRRDVDLKEGDLVLLSTKNIKFKDPPGQARKFLPKFIGPFKIKQQVHAVAFRLELPSRMKIHNVFHTSLLKPYQGDARRAAPAPEIIDGHEEYEVEQLLAHEIVGRKRRKPLIQYLVR